jgi:hypothetical protein
MSAERPAGLRRVDAVGAQLRAPKLLELGEALP